MARACGMSVRGLRHYDEIGLVPAGGRTAAGHRRYTQADVRRLYRVRALRGLGVSLEEIGAVLDGGDRVRDLLAAQLGELERQAAAIARLTGRIREVLARPGQPDAYQLMTILEMMTVYETAFTPAQQAELAARRDALGPDGIEAAKQEWAALVEQLLGHVAAGTPTTDPGVRELVARWDAVGERFHGDDGTKAAARRLWADHGDELGARLPWSAEQLRGLVAYLDDARG